MLNCLRNCGIELSRRVDRNSLTQLERSLLTHYLGFLVKVRSAYGYLLRLLFEDRRNVGFRKSLGDNNLGGGGIWWCDLAPRFNI